VNLLHIATQWHQVDKAPPLSVLSVTNDENAGASVVTEKTRNQDYPQTCQIH
jgi:hypothetical protein